MTLCRWQVSEKVCPKCRNSPHFGYYFWLFYTSRQEKRRAAVFSFCNAPCCLHNIWASSSEFRSSFRRICPILFAGEDLRPHVDPYDRADSNFSVRFAGEIRIHAFCFIVPNHTKTRLLFPCFDEETDIRKKKSFQKIKPNSGLKLLYKQKGKNDP